MKRVLYLLFIVIISCSNETDIVSGSELDFTITIIAGEGGTVSSQGGVFPQGSEISIEATPNSNYAFDAWSDGSTDNPKIILVTADISLTANFIFNCINNAPQIDLNKTSYDLFDIKYPLMLSGNINMNMSYWLGEDWEYGFGGAYVDYNNDGILDIVGYRNNYDNYIDYPQSYTGYDRKQLIKFFIGDCNGNFTPDSQNDNMYSGLVHGRKFLIGDFNNDSYVDFFLIGHGYDKQPFPGEFNKSLISNGNGGYIETNYTSLESFYHGGASGDFDNDGDLDVFVTDAGRGKAAIFENNNGFFSPTAELIDQNLMEGMYNAEFYDVNKDGFLDIICGGHDWTYGNVNSYDNTPLIIFGDGNNYVGNETLRLPKSSINGQGIVTDFNFYDLDGDNIEEIILTRTGDNQTDANNFYIGWSIQILKKSATTYTDQTNSFLNNFYDATGSWIRWSHFRDKDNDGKVEFFNTGYSGTSNYLEWELNAGFLSRQ
tara:strand:- start:118 stop:1578 length:1461 start_codon:yes stop_codon:yes gene_type:complete